MEKGIEELVIMVTLMKSSTIISKKGVFPFNWNFADIPLKFKPDDSLDVGYLTIMGAMASRKRNSICDKAVQVSLENLQIDLTLRTHTQAMVTKSIENESLIQANITKSREIERLIQANVTKSNENEHIQELHKQAMFARLRENKHLRQANVEKSRKNEHLIATNVETLRQNEHLLQANAEISMENELLRHSNVIISSVNKHNHDEFSATVTKLNLCMHDLDHMRKQEKRVKRVLYMQYFIFSLIIISFVTGCIQFA